MVLTGELAADIQRRYAAGEQRAVIAFQAKISRSSVDKILRGRGKPAPQRSPELIAEVARRFRSGETIRQIAACQQITISATRKILRKLDVASARMGDTTKRAIITAELKEIILKKRASGQTLGDIARDLGIGVSSVHRATGIRPERRFVHGETAIIREAHELALLVERGEPVAEIRDTISMTARQEAIIRQIFNGTAASYIRHRRQVLSAFDAAIARQGIR